MTSLPQAPANFSLSLSVRWLQCKLLFSHSQVVSSEFIRLDRCPSPGTAGSDASTISSILIYACVEANGLLRLWKWGDDGGGGWSWSYLNSCNICACREDPVGCRVLTASIVPEPEESSQWVGKKMLRLMWEQEDEGEGAGLGLALVPSTRPRLPRQVWSRRITVEFDNNDDAHGLAEQHAQEGGAVEGSALGVSSSNISEVALAFAACILPTGTDALLCVGRIGVWMPVGSLIFFNDFVTGRLQDSTLPRPPSGALPSQRRSELDGDVENKELDGFRGGEDDGDGFTGSDGHPENGKAPQEDSATDEEASETANWKRWSKTSSARRLFAVHDSTGDLVLYEYPGTMRIISLPSRGLGLTVGVQVTLDPPPPARAQSLVVQFNMAVLTGGGICSVYDLCNGRLLGATAIPRCPPCILRQRHRSKRLRPGSYCSCGRQSRLSAATTGWNRGLSTSNPTLWVSETRGHLVGILMATQVFRIKLPRPEGCLAVMLAPSCKGEGGEGMETRIFEGFIQSERCCKCS